ncbi:hypothetical protein BpHYR1_049339 [Brachionus plicatilis]|uniref:Uncharacterized protein n=1 Tax=Brachionus plicatilis TaxID=10195 RepID=A0A3M7SED5_BRAPC|nr:hypothetical protein BpHYR1_049339 [Brachionus plicatilis]
MEIIDPFKVKQKTIKHTKFRKIIYLCRISWKIFHRLIASFGLISFMDNNLINEKLNKKVHIVGKK